MSEPVYSGQAAPSPKASKAAIWSLILGILSITCLWLLGSIPAIILGAIGMKKAGADPENVGGKGIALAGLITGSVGIILGLVPVSMVAAVALPGVVGVQERAAETREINNMRQTILGIHTYAADSDGVFPEKLTDLLDEGYIDTDLVMHSQTASGSKGDMFQYRSGFSSVSRADEPILLSQKTFFAGKRVVGFVGGHVKSMRPEELDGILEKFE